MGEWWFRRVKRTFPVWWMCLLNTVKNFLLWLREKKKNNRYVRKFACHSLMANCNNHYRWNSYVLLQSPCRQINTLYKSFIAYNSSMYIKYSVLFGDISHQIVLNLISDKEYCSEIIHCCKLKLHTQDYYYIC